MRTYSRADLDAAQAAWSDFLPFWDEVRSIAAERGMLYPPAGSRFDERDDPLPSQRAIVLQALLDRPDWTRAIVAASSSWAQVVARILVQEGELREAADRRGAAIAAEQARWIPRSEADALYHELERRTGVSLP